MKKLKRLLKKLEKESSFRIHDIITEFSKKFDKKRKSEYKFFSWELKAFVFKFAPK